MISKKPIQQNNYKSKLFFYNSAREGWKSILNTLDKKTRILLPSYIGITEKEGSGIYDPVIETGISHDFYELTENLDVTYNEIKTKIIDSNYGLILFVHYFGYEISNIDKLNDLCKDNGIITVEDCAHLYNLNFWNKSNAGKYCDYSFYSLHKIFPFNKGGLVNQNNEKLKSPQYTLKLDCQINEIKSEIFSYKVNDIALKRRENFELYDKLLKNQNLIYPLKNLKEGDIPHNYPVLISNNLREKLYFWLIDNGITLIALYYRLINPLQKSKYEKMEFISNNILNLPLHQDILPEDIEKVVFLLKKGIKEL